MRELISRMFVVTHIDGYHSYINTTLFGKNKEEHR